MSVPELGSFYDAYTIRMYKSADGKQYVFTDRSNSLTWHQLKRRIIPDSSNVIDHYVPKIFPNSIISPPFGFDAIYSHYRHLTRGHRYSLGHAMA